MEMASFTSSPEAEPEVKAVGSLAGHVSLDWLRVKSKGGRDMEKAAVFIRELKDAEKSGDWPNFMVMSLGEDHTHVQGNSALTDPVRQRRTFHQFHHQVIRPDIVKLTNVGMVE
jgi:hypothetical protein